jgi:hypothetical protein
MSTNTLEKSINDKNQILRVILRKLSEKYMTTAISLIYIATIDSR